MTVHLASSRTGAVSAYRSQCSCPMAQDCKHAAAVLIVARHLAAAAQLVERPEWEKTLDKLIAGTPAPLVDIAPLALEFGVERIPAFRGYVGRQDLRIRPARLGKAGNWVRSGIGWDDLDFVARSYVPEHRELLLQFRAAAGAGARYALPRSAWLSLGAVGSGFWGLLDQAATTGLTMITAKPLLGPIQAERRGLGRPGCSPDAGRARARAAGDAGRPGAAAGGGRRAGRAGPRVVLAAPGRAGHRGTGGGPADRRHRPGPASDGRRCSDAERPGGGRGPVSGRVRGPAPAEGRADLHRWLGAAAELDGASTGPGCRLPAWPSGGPGLDRDL